MPEATPEFLTEILGSVLQDTAFMFVEPAEEAVTWGDQVFAATLAFESVRGGLLRLTVSPPVAFELAANMLGTEPDDPEAAENGRAAVSEVLNVIGGAFVTRYFGSKVPSQLGLPSAALSDKPSTGKHCCAAEVISETGDPVRLELDLEE